MAPLSTADIIMLSLIGFALLAQLTVLVALHTFAAHARKALELAHGVQTFEGDATVNFALDPKDQRASDTPQAETKQGETDNHGRDGQPIVARRFSAAEINDLPFAITVQQAHGTAEASKPVAPILIFRLPAFRDQSHIRVWQ